MGWVMESLANVFLEIINDVIRFMIVLVQKVAFNPVKDATGNYHAMTEHVFPALSQFNNYIIITAWMLIMILALYKMAQVLVDHEGKAEHPGSVLLRVSLAGVLVKISMLITSEMINAMSGIYRAFYSVMNGSIGGIEKITETKSAYALFGTDIIRDAGWEGWSNKLGSIVIMVMVGVIIASYFFMLVLEFITRYIIIDIMYITSPLAFATIATKDTSQIFKKWFQMFITNFIVMAMTLMFLAAFISGFQYVTSGLHAKDVMDLDEIPKAWFGLRDAPEYLFKDIPDFAYTMIMLSAILVTGTKIDQYLKDLGLTVAQTGQGVGGALLGSAMVIRAGAQTIGNGVRTAGSFGLGYFTKGKMGSGLSGTAGSKTREKTDAMKEERAIRKDPSRNASKAVDTQDAKRLEKGSELTQDQKREAAMTSIGKDTVANAERDAKSKDWDIKNDDGRLSYELKDKDGNTAYAFAPSDAIKPNETGREVKSNAVNPETGKNVSMSTGYVSITGENTKAPNLERMKDDLTKAGHTNLTPIIATANMSSGETRPMQVGWASEKGGKTYGNFDGKLKDTPVSAPIGNSNSPSGYSYETGDKGSPEFLTSRYSQSEINGEKVASWGSQDARQAIEQYQEATKFMYGSSEIKPSDFESFVEINAMNEKYSAQNAARDAAVDDVAKRNSDVWGLPPEVFGETPKPDAKNPPQDIRETGANQYFDRQVDGPSVPTPRNQGNAFEVSSARSSGASAASKANSTRYEDKSITDKGSERRRNNLSNFLGRRGNRNQ